MKVAPTSWKSNRIGGDPKVAGRELLRIERAYGMLDAGIVVDEARDPGSPLHRYFTWDDTVAAEEHRKTQARHLLRAVVMSSPARESETIRAFLMIAAEEGGAYANTIRVMSDPMMRAQVLARAKAELRALRQKYGHLSELAAVMAAIDKETRR